MKCRKCGRPDNELDRRVIRFKLVEALRFVADHPLLDENGRGGSHYNLGYLRGTVESVVARLDGVCFSCADRHRDPLVVGPNG